MQVYCYAKAWGHNILWRHQHQASGGRQNSNPINDAKLLLDVSGIEK
jgi:hypothetical protein